MAKRTSYRTLRMKAWLIEHLKTSLQNAFEVHSRSLRKSEGWARLGIALLIYTFVSWSLLDSNIKIGGSFLFSGFMVIYSGIIYKGRYVMAFVIGGVFLGLTVLPTFVGVWKSIRAGDWIGAMFVIFLGILLWLWSSRMKSGEPPE